MACRSLERRFREPSARVDRPPSPAGFGGAGFGRRARRARRNRRRDQPAPVAERKRDGRHRPRRVRYGVPYADFINAAFAYWKPWSPTGSMLRAGPGTRRSRSRPACAKSLTTWLIFWRRSGVSTRAWSNTRNCSPAWRGSSSTCRQAESHPCLDPDPANGYPIGNALADAALARGLNGVIYPSVRHPMGTCIVALRPYAVQSVAQGAVFRFEWSGSAQPTITRVSEEHSKTARD